MSTWRRHPRKGGQTPARSPLVTFRSHAIAFNAPFVAHAGLDEMTRVSVFVDSSRFRVGFRFHSDVEDEHSYALGSDGGGRGKGRAAQCSSLMTANPWIAAVARTPEPSLRRFVPQWQPAQSLWTVSLHPAFEVRVSRKSDIPSEVRGIYRYRRRDEIVYIGRGAIRARLNAPERKEWDIEVVEYSALPDEEEQKQWEAFWLDRFVERHGKLPLYNRIGS